MQWHGGRFEDDCGGVQADGTGRIEEFGFCQAQPRPPDRRIGDKNELSAGNVGQPAVGCRTGGQQGTQLLVQRIEPEGTTQGSASFTRQSGFGRGKWIGCPAGVGLQIRHT
jgi:hypothetical protein